MARRRNHNTKWVGAVLVGIFIVILILTFTSKKSDKKNTKQLVIGISQEPDTLDPTFAQMTASWEIIYLLFDGQLEWDSDWNRTPATVISRPTFENGLMKKLSNGDIEVIWQFKKGLKYSDGHAVLPKDYILFHNMVLDERLPVVSRDFNKKIRKMEAPDDHTLVVTWKEPYAFAGMWGHDFVPSHIVEPLYKKNPEKYNESSFNRHPIGNGPFKLDEWVEGSHIILSQNPHWSGPKPKFEKIIYKIISATNAMESNLLSGTIDVISPLGLTLDQALDFERRHGEKFNFLYRPALTWEHIDFNLDNFILKDKRVRQALLYGANRQMIVDILFQGKQPVSHSWLPPMHYGYDPSIKKYEFNPDKAKALLEEAGWILSPSGVRVNNRGDLLKLTIMTTAGNKTREQVQQILQADWKKIGVELSIENQPGRVFFGDTMKHRKFKHLAMYAWMQSPISEGVTLWTQHNIPSKKNNWQGQNVPGWVHEESDRINLQVPLTFSERKRTELLQKGLKIWVEELPAIPLFFKADNAVIHKALRNYALTGNKQPSSWNAETWKFQMR
jgi:peptide/nickel transport system substrate-binding protein